jgi:hypothetical protein
MRLVSVIPCNIGITETLAKVEFFNISRKRKKEEIYN